MLKIIDIVSLYYFLERAFSDMELIFIRGRGLGQRGGGGLRNSLIVKNYFLFDIPREKFVDLLRAFFTSSGRSIVLSF